MKINQEKIFKPVTIVIETREELNSLIKIIDEVNCLEKDETVFMEKDSRALAVEISNWISNNMQ